jgi:hypothetical protein
MAPTPSERLRQAIMDSDLSVCAIARLAHVSHCALYRFLNHRRSLSLPSIDRLCLALDLALLSIAVERRPRGRARHSRA